MAAGVKELDNVVVEVNELAVEDGCLLVEGAPCEVVCDFGVVCVDTDVVLVAFEVRLALVEVEAGDDEVVVTNVEVAGVVGPQSPQYF